MSDLEQEATSACNNPLCTPEARIVILAQRGVIDHMEWQLADLEVRYRKAEYNYASTKLKQANAKLKEHKK